jgi:type IV secretion system protein VirD4
MTATGLPLGFAPPDPRRRGLPSGPRVPVVDDGEGHLITFAPTGAGKGVSCIIPALLTWDGPAIVIDPKGENYAVTAAQRAKLGQRVAVLDPFGVTGAASDALNPLDLIDPDCAHATDDAAVITQLLVGQPSLRADPFWDARARDLLTGLILHVLLGFYSPARSGPQPAPTLGDVRRIVEASELCQRLKAIAMRRWLCAETSTAANILELDSDRTRASIITTASSHINFIGTGPVDEALGPSTVRLADVQHGTPLTVYLVVPPDKLLSHGKLLRVWLGVLMTALCRRRRRPPRPTLLLIDEAAQLGSLDQLRSAVTLLRGYGVKCWTFWQDLSQLYQLYPLDWRTLVNNCAVQQYFAQGTPQAAAELDAYLAGAAPRPNLRLTADDVLLIRRGEPPRLVIRSNYLRDPELRGLAAPNPFYQAEAAAEPALSGAEIIPFPLPGR